MRRIFGFVLALTLTLCLGGTVHAADGDYLQFQRIIDSNCSQCHTRARIEAAMRDGVNYQETIQKMIRFGARISEQDQRVLGVFWTSQGIAGVAGEQPGRTVSKDPLGEFRAVLENRCTGCHTLDRVEDAMMQGRSIDDLVEMMRKRGAIVTKADKSIPGTFWGEPLKTKPK